MTVIVHSADDTTQWREALTSFERVDVCQTPEYHKTYETRIQNAKAMMWCYEDGDNRFCYPFLLTPVQIGDIRTDYKDISSIYGYSGALCSGDKAFLKQAWSSFDEWAKNEKIIAEFTRFSLYAKTQDNAHPNVEILENRPSAISYLDGDLFTAIGKKTRNMIRKAEKSGLKSRELDLKSGLPAFRQLYDQTMQRNDATEFFDYDDVYYDLLTCLPAGELRLFGAFEGNDMVATAMSLSYKEGALYHLGASEPHYARLGAGNLVLYEMSKNLMSAGIKFLTVGGGRTTAEDDALFRFKKSNATTVETFCIGKRITDTAGYKDVVTQWEETHGAKVNSENLIFYR